MRNHPPVVFGTQAEYVNVSFVIRLMPFQVILERIRYDSTNQTAPKVAQTWQRFWRASNFTQDLYLWRTLATWFFTTTLFFHMRLGIGCNGTSHAKVGQSIYGWCFDNTPHLPVNSTLFDKSRKGSFIDCIYLQGIAFDWGHWARGWASERQGSLRKFEASEHVLDRMDWTHQAEVVRSNPYLRLPSGGGMYWCSSWWMCL